MGYNPKDHKESDMTEQLGKHTHTRVCLCVRSMPTYIS